MSESSKKLDLWYGFMYNVFTAEEKTPCFLYGHRMNQAHFILHNTEVSIICYLAELP